MNNTSPSPHDGTFVRNALEASLRISVVVLLAVWVFSIVKPFLIPILWGIIIAIAVYPAYGKLQAAFGGRRGLAAAVFTLAALVILIAPAVMLASALVDNSIQLSEKISAGTLEIPPPGDRVGSWPLIGEPVEEFWRLASENLGEALQQLRPQLLTASGWLLGVAASTGFSILQFIFAIIIAGVLLARAESGQRAAHSVAARLAGGRGEGFADLAEATVRSVATGIVGVAIIQSILAGLGFLAIGLPGAGVWALIILILSVIQIGAVIVLIPIVIYVFSTMEVTIAVVFMIWCVFVGVIDNILKPILLGRGIDVPMLVIFMGAIGGFLSMGIIGLFVGSVVLVVGFRLLQAWLEEGAQAAASTANAESAGEAKSS